MLARFCARFLSPHSQQVIRCCQRLQHSGAVKNVPVVIVGAGPTGLVLSCLLTQYGVRHVLLERSQQLTMHPQAHYINNRTMEVLHGLDGLSAAVAAASPPLDQWRRFIYCEAAADGQLLGQVDHFPGQHSPQDASVSPEPVAHLSQHRLLPLLLQKARQLSAAHGDCADICFSTAVSLVTRTANTQHAQHVQHSQQPQSTQQQLHQTEHSSLHSNHSIHVTVRRTDASGGVEIQEIRCRYLAAADGAHSPVRQLLGIGMLGEPTLQHLMSIHFTWPALGQALLQQGRAGMLYFVFNRHVVAVLVAHNLHTGEFVAQVPYFPPLQSAHDFTPERCQQLIAAAAGQSLHDRQQHLAAVRGTSGPGALQLHSVKTWVMSAEVAESFAACDNHAMLLGDAAHRFPPAGGFGMNTGIQDAHNLAWKLAAVIHGTADHKLLATYHQERRPIAQANTSLSVSNWIEAIRIPQALGLDPRAASIVNSMVSAAPLPIVMSRWLLNSALAAGRGLAAAVASFRQGALQHILDAGDSLRLQFPQEDLGFVYNQGAVVQEQQQQLQCSQVNSNSSSSGWHRKQHWRGNVYIPSTTVGGRLPHCQLSLLDSQCNVKEQVSTIDLVTADRLGLNMLLICSSSTTHTAMAVADEWLAAGLHLKQQGWPLQLLSILPRHSSSIQAMASRVSSRSHVTNSTDGTDGSSSDISGGGSASCGSQPGVMQALSVTGTWEALHPGCESVAVLVRPDGHVAWRHINGDQSSCHAKSEPGGMYSSSSGCSAGSNSSFSPVWVLQSVLQNVLQLRPHCH